VAASPYGDAVLRQSSHIRIGYPIHHFRGREPAAGRRAGALLAPRMGHRQRRCGPDRESGHRGQQLAGKDGFMLDHLSIQCADVAASATFYDAVLAPLGGRRVMDFGEVIGFVCRPGQSSGSARGPPARGSARRISRSWRPTGLPCGHSSRQRSALMPKCSMNHACGPSNTQAITAPSCVTPTATTSKPFATLPDSDCRRACRHLPLLTTVRLLQVRVEPERCWLLRRR